MNMLKKTNHQIILYVFHFNRMLELMKESMHGKSGALLNKVFIVAEEYSCIGPQIFQVSLQELTSRKPMKHTVFVLILNTVTP